MIVFAAHDGPRLRYACSVIGQQLYGKPLQLTCNRGIFEQHNGARINYSNQRSSVSEIFIRPQGLLTESGIRPQGLLTENGIHPQGMMGEFGIFAQRIVDGPDTGEAGAGLPVSEMNTGIADPIPGSELPVADDGFLFFKNDSDTGFDIFSAVFYLVSRYEEYLPAEKDEYGRFAHTASLAFRAGFLHLPLADQWIAALKQQLEAVFPYEQLLHRNSFFFRPTYDIDIAFSYRHKGVLRTAAGWLRSLGGRGAHASRMALLRERLAVLGGRRADPFDSFGWLNELHTRYALRPVYFFLLAGRTGIYDKNNHPAGAAMQELVRTHASKYTTGIHPSWRSGDEPAELEKEISRLRTITKREVKLSRQHYIRFTLPGSFRQLAAAGISDDYSMGYGSINGFRASTSFPFYWYDLEAERETGLLMHPFCFMDANSFYEQGQDATTTLEEMKGYLARVTAVNGHLVMIWHNHFLGTDPRFGGWKEIYERFVAIAAVEK